jgi:hypothetical protein
LCVWNKQKQLDDCWWTPAGAGLPLTKPVTQSRSGGIQLIATIFFLVTIGLCVVGWTTTPPEESTATTLLQTDQLFNLRTFDYRLNSPQICAQSTVQPFFLALVHSKANHFRQRQVIRQTWASQRDLIRHVFLIGLADQTGLEKGTMDIQSLLESENAKYSDLVQGEFVDHYRNLTYKNLMGLKWVGQYCPSVSFVLKSDDDAFIDVAQLRKFIERTWPSGPPAETLICNVHEDAVVQRSGKWAVSDEEYPSKTYPAFCSGLAYVMRPQLASKLLRSASRVKALWVDDVFVTGILAASVNVRHFYLNLRYTHQQDDLVQWLETNLPSNPLPFIVSELDTSRSEWPRLAHRLWNRTCTYNAVDSDS